MKEDRNTPRRSGAAYAMTGATSRAVRERDADRPIPFFLADQPVPFACSDFSVPDHTDDPRAWVP